MKRSYHKTISLIVISLITCVIFLGGCSINRQQKEPDHFLLWYDGYVAGGYNDTIDFSYTLLSKSNDLETAISDVKFSDKQFVSIEKFSVERVKSTYKGYKFYGINLKMKLNQKGQYSPDALIVTINGKEQRLPLGTWTFDIGEKGSEKIDTWESIAASSSSDTFSYEYTLKDASISKCNIYTNIDTSSQVSLKKKGKFSGKINISDSDAPLKYIKTKILYTVNGKPYSSYGQGCYCGALGLTDKNIQSSCDYTKDRLNGTE